VAKIGFGKKALQSSSLPKLLLVQAFWAQAAWLRNVNATAFYLLEKYPSDFSNSAKAEPDKKRLLMSLLVLGAKISRGYWFLKHKAWFLKQEDGLWRSIIGFRKGSDGDLRCINGIQKSIIGL
jgi:hypothetical protein